MEQVGHVEESLTYPSGVQNNHRKADHNNGPSLQVDEIRLHIPFKVFAVTTVCLPLLSMLFCFVTALIFQFDRVNHTFCKVQNFIPSISAITGITPQRYLWRICIGLHSTPRYLIAVMYYNHFKSRLQFIQPDYRNIYMKLVTFNFWLNVVENSCLIGVTYISNVENYPLHEKIFIMFMVTAIMYMILCTLLFKYSLGPNPTDLELKSLRWKWNMLAVIVISTIGLLVFFYKHRVQCAPGAFSLFSLCEYGIAISNIAYHFTGAWDFSGNTFVLGKSSLKAGELNRRKVD